jgi:hypothetical protein
VTAAEFVGAIQPCATPDFGSFAGVVVAAEGAVRGPP